MDRAWLIDSRGLAKKVKSASLSAANQIEEFGAKLQCPNCCYLIDNSDVSEVWPGLPAGVKFEPSDIELLEHLSAKRRVGDLEPHVSIDEFIPTLEGDEGICYTHPENLPGAKKDGSSVYFFYRIANAYASGRRKRRRIQDQENTVQSHVRWHKTGKTKPVMENGVQKGFKKIMVLYAVSKKGSKPDKCNWVMHQYHLGTNEDEPDGEYVVSKIYYQTDKNETPLVAEESDVVTAQVIPMTPKTNTPVPPRPEKIPSSDFGLDDYLIQDYLVEQSCPSSGSQLKDEMENATSLAGKSEAVDLSVADSLLCNEKIDSYAAFDGLRPNSNISQRDDNASCGIGDLYDLELDTPPDFYLPDLQFPSQDSVFDFAGRL